MSQAKTEEQLTRRMPQSQLVVEREVFKRKYPGFRAHLGEYVLIFGDKVFGFYPTSADAHAAAYSNPQIGVDASFLVRQIQETMEGQIDTYNLMNIAELAGDG
jgi:hypothetical protein